MTRPTILFLHAHPDDECILTGATIAGAVDAGWRVLVAYGTRGDAGETNKDLTGDTLGERRTREALSACAELGVDRVEWLGYDDSGMAGTETTGNAEAFSNASLSEVAARIGRTFSDERIDAVVGYDRHGTYGHPDHVQVHAITRPTAHEVGASWVLEATYNRDYLESLDEHPYSGTVADDPTAFGASFDEVTHFVEGHELFARKDAAIAHHHSQVPDDWDPDNRGIEQLDGFARVFGTEWYITHRIRGGADWSPFASLFCDKLLWSGAPPSMREYVPDV
ncbi:MAG: GlcNAc-PI de-N-acetylase [Actinomycetia bacterium]|nr:GlcNAc-PI de-N-acetylase [Actinomycetes bacterium]MCP4957757.1 GlcNAc-PI de-N-acetylase [Actinomycetes bacterium]